MTNNVRKINKLLNVFWACVLLAPIVSWVLLSSVALFQGMPESVSTVGDFIEKFIGFSPVSSWLDSMWTKLFAVNGLIPFSSLEVISMPIINYLLLWAVLRLFISIFIWLPCFAQKLIERWFE